jgi:hypothetical protein
VNLGEAALTAALGAAATGAAGAVAVIRGLRICTGRTAGDSFGARPALTSEESR